MSNIAISGWGIISELGNSEDDIIKNWDAGKLPNGTALDFVHNLDPRKARRMSRLGKMLTSVSQKCLIMSESSGGDRTGIIMNTNYGSINLNIEFGKVLKTPELASPMDFSNTVSNAALGNVALYFKLKGRSTLLMGSNAISYSMRLLEKKNDEKIVVCGADEYCEPIIDYANANLGENAVCEGVAAVLIENNKKTEWGYIIGDSQGGIGFSPLYEKLRDVKDNYKNVIEKALESSGLSKNDINVVFMSGDRYSGIRQYEDEAVDVIFGKKQSRKYTKDFFGESMGASAISSIVLASILIKNNRYENILVLGTEVSGTLEAFVISKNERG